MKTLKVNPNRMELLKLKRRLRVAERGYELLKEKRDSLTQKFLGLVRRNLALRKEVEKNLQKIYLLVDLARALSGRAGIEEALAGSSAFLELEIKSGNLIGVAVPQYGFRLAGEPFCYGYLDTNSFLDEAVALLKETLPALIELAEIEKTIALLAEEIEKTRRRVNALEHILIPDLKNTVAFIVAKLDQLERSSFVTLLKMKELVKK